MSCFNRYRWELVPDNLPVVKRNCPKCKGKTSFINTEKFRVNANKNNIDVWLIYQCEKCKSTWNMTIYERVSPKDIDKEEYEGFLSNDLELAKKYGFDIGLYMKNRAEVILENISYKVNKYTIEESSINEDSIITITTKFPLEIRMDKFLSDNLNLSRSRVKSMIDEGHITINISNKLMKVKIVNSIELYVKNL